MQIFIYIVIISFLVRTIRNILYLTFLWQLKEYRLDRMLVHLKTQQGKKLIFEPITLVKWILFLGILTGYDFYFYYAFWIIWIIEAFFNIRESVLFRWRLPRFTLKTTLILLVILFIISDFLLRDISDIGTTILIGGVYVDRFIGMSITIIIGILNLPVNFYKKWIIWKAKNKLDKLKKLTVIGITGSYGKTSTKEFLATILSRKFKVAKTPEFTNTDIGIAKYILKELNPEHEVFVVEMGAYKKGEIKDICEIVKPKVGIITGINQQHLQLFGSLEKTVAAKFELIENLSKKGIAVFNTDNKWVNEMVVRTKRQRPDLEVVTYGCRGKSNLVAGNIQTTAENIKFNLFYSGKKESLQLQLAGEQNVVNFLGAVAASGKLGVSFSEIKKSAFTIQAPTKTMKKVSGINQSAFIDDTFNANPDGVMAALNYMKIYKGKKILVLTPLIELGNDADKIHKDLGKKAAWVCDLILLTNLNYNSPFLKGAAAASGSKKVQIVNTAVGIKLIKQNIDREGIVVFEGKEAGKMLDELVKLV